MSGFKNLLEGEGSGSDVRLGWVVEELIAFMKGLSGEVLPNSEGGGDWRGQVRLLQGVCADHLDQFGADLERVRRSELNAESFDELVSRAGQRVGVSLESEFVAHELIIEWGMSCYVEWGICHAIHHEEDIAETFDALRSEFERAVIGDVDDVSMIVDNGSELVGSDDSMGAWYAYVAEYQKRFRTVPRHRRYSLEQIYLDVRAVYLEQDREAGEWEASKRIGVKLCDYMCEWILDDLEKKAMNAVIGARGMGKTTFCTAFIAKHALELEKQGCVVLRLPVGALDLSNSVEAAFTGYCQHDLNLGFDPFSGEFLENYRILLLLDGLEELDRRDGAAAGTRVVHFVSQVGALVERLNQNYGQTRLHVTFVGMPSVAEYGGEHFRGESLLEILPFASVGLWKTWWPTESKSGFYGGDLNDAWWKRWQDLNGAAIENPRKMIDVHGAASLVCRPFFNELLAYALVTAKLDLKGKCSLNHLYERLGTYLMGRLDGHRRRLDQAYLECLEELAVLRWQKLDWQLSAEQMMALFQSSKYMPAELKQLLDPESVAFVDSVAKRILNEDVLLNVSGGIEKLLFWDFLVARRLVRVVARLGESQVGECIEEKLDEWLELMAYCPINDSTYYFVRALLSEHLEVLNDKSRVQWQEVFAELFGYVVKEGVAIERVMPGASYAEMQLGVWSAETSLAVVLGMIAEVTKRVSAVEWDTSKPLQLGSWLMRVNGQRTDYVSSSLTYGASQLLPTPMLMRSLNYLNFTGQTLTVQNLSSSKLQGALMRRVHLSRSSFRYGDLRDAQVDHSELIQVTMDHAQLSDACFDHSDLTEARMQQCEMHGASFIRARLRNADLSHAHAESCSFSWAKMREAVLTHTILDDSRFNGAELQSCDVRNASLIDCSFDEVNATEVSFRESRLDGASMVNTDLSSAIFEKVSLKGVGLFRATLKKADFKDCQMLGVNLEKAKMRGVSISSCELQGASLNLADLREATITGKTDMQGASLNEANLGAALFNGVNLERCTFEKAVITDKTKWVDCKMSGADFNGVVLDGVTMSGNILERAHFIGAKLNGAKLGQAKLERSILDRCEARGAHFKEAMLDGASMFQARLNEADLEAASMKGVNLHGANLDEVNLMHADLRDASLFGASMVGADLRLAQLEGANLFGANFEKVKIEMEQLSDEQRGQIRGNPEWVLRNDAINSVFRRDEKSLDCLEITQRKEEMIIVDGEIAEVIEGSSVITSSIHKMEEHQP